VVAADGVAATGSYGQPPHAPLYGAGAAERAGYGELSARKS
jgi:hypothetical protein